MYPLAFALLVALPALVHSDRREYDKKEGAVRLSVESSHFEQEKSESSMVPGKFYLCTEKWAKNKAFKSTGHLCLIDEDQANTMLQAIQASSDKHKPKFYVEDASKCASKSKPHLFKICPTLKDNNRVHYSGRIFRAKSCFRETPATWPGVSNRGKPLQIQLVASALDDKQCQAQSKLQKKYQGKLRRIRKDGADEGDHEIEEDEDEDEDGDDDDDDDVDPEEERDNINVDGDTEMGFQDRIAMWKELDQKAHA